jgi:hypothetical protein
MFGGRRKAEAMWRTASLTIGLALISLGALAAELPRQFHGLWVAAEVPNKDKCRRDEPRGEDDRPVDVMMSVEGKTITYYEHQCTVQSAKMLHALSPDDTSRINVDVNLACRGEGMLWSAHEIWHVETIDDRKVIVVTALSQSNYRNEKGRREKAPSRIWTSIYYPCK